MPNAYTHSTLVFFFQKFVRPITINYFYLFVKVLFVCNFLGMQLKRVLNFNFF